MKCRLILLHWNQGRFRKFWNQNLVKKFRFPKKKLSLAEGLENLKIRIYKEMLRTNRQNVLMGNPKSENRRREYHLMSVSENQFRCSIENRISAGKTLFPGNSIIFATFPPLPSSTPAFSWKQEFHQSFQIGRLFHQTGSIPTVIVYSN